MCALKILIAEDELLMAFQLIRQLRKEGHEVLEPILSGEEVPPAVTETNPDLILMDVNLQGEIDGIQAAEKIREQSRVPIIFMTGYSDRGTLDQIARFTNALAIIKPVAFNEIADAIDHLTAV